MRILILTIMAVVLMSGCSHTNNLLKVEDKEQKNREFRGLVDVINQPGNTSILFIHGMGGYSSNDGKIDPCNVINDVRGAYGLEPAAFNLPQWYCENTFQVNGKTVHLRSMHWGDITSLRKLRLQNVDDEPTFRDNRAPVTNLLKENIINRGFSDALMYTGVYRKEILERVVESYSQINQDNPNAKVVVVTFSLGSVIMMDSLDELEKRKKEALLKDKVEMIYMMANQVPLIRTGTQPLVKQTKNGVLKDIPDAPLYKSLAPYLAKRDKLRADDDIRVVAFSDPNDLLSYPLDAYNMGPLGSQYVNVAISIADKTYYVPFYKKKTGVVDYLKAHTGHVYYAKLKELLLNGNRAPSSSVTK